MENISMVSKIVFASSIFGHVLETKEVIIMRFTQLVRMRYIVVSLLILLIGGWKISSKDAEIPITLKGTNWVSHFYHYHNNYFFETDSTGFSEDGQMAWSCTIDTVALGISGDEILYANPEKFKYTIGDSTLTIEYLNWRPQDSVYTRVFYFRSQNNDWLSDYEYVYGKECLRQGVRVETFHW